MFTTIPNINRFVNRLLRKSIMLRTFQMPLVKENERQLTDEKCYTILDENQSKTIEHNILNYVKKISETNSAVE